MIKYLRRLSLTRALYSTVRGRRRASIRGTSVEYQVESFNEALAVDYLIRTEQPVLTDLLGELQSGDVFFDIGANFGLYTCLAASVANPDDVYAVEPYPPNPPRIRRNHELNGTPGVPIVEKAFTDFDGEIAFDPPDQELAIKTMSRIRPSESDGYTVDAVKGDTFCADEEVSEPNVIKIDVEGAEAKVLEGFQETIAGSSCRAIYCEIHTDEDGISVSDYGASEADIESLLTDCGFNIETLHRRLEERHIKATK